MTYSIEYVSNHLFIDGFHGRLFSNNYFRCYDQHCPFFLLMDVKKVAGKTVAVSCVSAVVPVHIHHSDRTRMANRTIARSQLAFIKAHPTDPKTNTYEKEHAHWNRVARRHSKKYKLYLVEVEAVKVYALEHQEKTAKQIKDDCCLSLDPQSICNIVAREKTKRGMTVDFDQMLLQKHTTSSQRMGRTL